jgi:hypothetical protein
MLNDPVAHFLVVCRNSNESRLYDVLFLSNKSREEIKLVFDLVNSLFLISNNLQNRGKITRTDNRHNF